MPVINAIYSCELTAQFTKEETIEENQTLYIQGVTTDSTTSRSLLAQYGTISSFTQKKVKRGGDTSYILTTYTTLDSAKRAMTSLENTRTFGPYSVVKYSDKKKEKHKTSNIILSPSLTTQQPVKIGRVRSTKSNSKQSVCTNETAKSSLYQPVSLVQQVPQQFNQYEEVNTSQVHNFDFNQQILMEKTSFLKEEKRECIFKTPENEYFNAHKLYVTEVTCDVVKVYLEEMTGLKWDVKVLNDECFQITSHQKCDDQFLNDICDYKNWFVCDFEELKNPQANLCGNFSLKEEQNSSCELKEEKEKVQMTERHFLYLINTEIKQNSLIELFEDQSVGYVDIKDTVNGVVVEVKNKEEEQEVTEFLLLFGIECQRVSDPSLLQCFKSPKERLCNTTNEEFKLEVSNCEELQYEDVCLHEEKDIEREKTTFSCEICYEDVEESEAFTFTPCQHKYCKSCVLSLCKERVNSLQEIFCPHEKCHCPLEGDKLYTLDYQTAEKYNVVLFRLYVLRSDNLIFCPIPNCNGVLEKVEKTNQVTCPECQNTFCFKCREMWHKDFTCEQAKSLQRSDLTDKEIAQIMAKKCPRCKMYISKENGCNTITCKCGCIFCWTCGKDVTNDDTHFSRNVCKMYD
ncbi:ariadne RING finger, putative [Entamoeba invadens IP1]|uniref:RBR-type E3 ubiquitin transferase n=1 Tax=Entamoeba invadens IP1 TaxID=370355 RepID=A0A0A1UB56_ENTIV|nr:ariadne RING finger, putative [Entamoeba invadens IP1]ELP92437.1 ariadne RING finger, putative [Entamoeba invadens IP1]|eukprot:XP_004259208.1 ariadne RING finger, putative [Entamoeba invadens IP1]